MITVRFNFKPQAENFVRIIYEGSNMVLISGPKDTGYGFEVVYRKAGAKEAEIKRIELTYLKKQRKYTRI